MSDPKYQLYKEYGDLEDIKVNEHKMKFYQFSFSRRIKYL